MKTIAVIPAYNEAKNIKDVVKNTRKHVDKVVVVDDHSKDNTFDIAKKSGATAVRLVTNMGAGFATRVGCDLAVREGADIIVTLDADGQHDPAEIPRLVDVLKKNQLDIVFGSRQKSKDMPLVKRIGNTGLSLIAKILFRIDIKDSQTGYHVFTSKTYPKLRWTSTRYGVVTEFVVRVAKNRLKYKEVDVKTIYTGKKTGMSKKDAVKSIWSMIQWRFRG